MIHYYVLKWCSLDPSGSTLANLQISRISLPGTGEGFKKRFWGWQEQMDYNRCSFVTMALYNRENASCLLLWKINPPNVESDNDFGSGVRTLPFSSYHTFQLLFHFNYSSNESGAAFIKLSGGKDILKLQHGKQVQQIVLRDQQMWQHHDHSRIGELLRASSQTLEQKAPDVSLRQWRVVSRAAVFSQSWHIQQIGNEGPLHFCRITPITPLPKVPI